MAPLKFIKLRHICTPRVSCLCTLFFCLENKSLATPLTDALRSGNMDRLIMLLAEGADVNEPGNDSYGRNVLHWAVIKNEIAMTKTLLQDPNIDINQGNNTGNTALHFAAAGGHTEILQMLLSRPELDVNKANLTGKTALHWASYFGKSSAAQILLQNSNIHASLHDNNGMTPIELAIQFDHPDIVSAILNSEK